MTNCCARAAVMPRSTGCRSRSKGLRQSRLPPPRRPHAALSLPTVDLESPCVIWRSARPVRPRNPSISKKANMSNGKRYVIPPPPQAALAVAGTADLFPVRRIWCVGRNYLEHIKEMGQDEREPPFFFAKPADAVVPEGGTVPYPPLTKDLHHEVELVVALKSGGRNIPEDKALDCVWAYGVGIDLTRRDLQIASRDIKRPWEIGKAFDASAPCGPLT